MRHTHPNAHSNKTRNNLLFCLKRSSSFHSSSRRRFLKASCCCRRRRRPGCCWCLCWCRWHASNTLEHTLFNCCVHRVIVIAMKLMTFTVEVPACQNVPFSHFKKWGSGRASNKWAPLLHCVPLAEPILPHSVICKLNLEKLLVIYQLLIE